MEINKEFFLNSKYLDVLRDLKNSNINISSEILDGRTDSIKIQSGDFVYYITNEPTKFKDDEWPIINIDTSLNFPFTENYTLENVKILSTSIIRDDVSWIFKGIQWRIKIDIGMKFITDKKDIVLILMDSGAGLMIFMYGDKIEIPNSIDSLEDQWGYRSDEFVHLSREEIVIF